MRTYVLTGSSSGIGRVTKTRLEAAGARVIGVDLFDADVTVDLSLRAEREAMVERVRTLAGESIDGVIACAGLSAGGASAQTVARIDNTRAEPILLSNYFGAIGTLNGLRPLLAAGTDPRAVAIASVSMFREPDVACLDACLAEDEEGAVRALRACGADAWLAYGIAKLALARWVRRRAVSPEWGGAGITLNAISPGAIGGTAMSDRSQAAKRLETPPPPLPANGGPLERALPYVGKPDDPAALLAFLAGPENAFVTGQVIFIDGGMEANRRGDDVF